MASAYQQFNRWVCDYYDNNLIEGQINTLTIPKSEIDNFVASYKIELDTFDEIKYHYWGKLIEYSSNNQPIYLGLIALQCLAAYTMQADDDIAASNYRERFIHIVGIDSVETLNNLFEGIFSPSDQEKLWYETKQYFSRKKIKIVIPEMKSHKNRFIQYPLSQSILNCEDLKEYKPFYLSIAKRFDVIRFEDFVGEYDKYSQYLKSKYLRRNNHKELSESECKVKKKQIFDYYISEEWCDEYYRKCINQRYYHDYILLLKDEIITIIDSNFYKKDTISNIGSHLLFKEDDFYLNEFNIINRISTLGRYIILFDKTNKANDIPRLEISKYKNCTTYDINSRLRAYLFNYEIEGCLPNFLHSLLESPYPIKLIGKKISRKNEYLVTNPPIIEVAKGYDYSLFFNSELIKFKQPIEVGRYSIRVSGYSKYTFEIVNIPEIKILPQFTDCFLSFKSLDYQVDGEEGMAGLILKNDSNNMLSDLSIHNWIHINNGKKTRSNNIILKALILNKHGQSY